MAALTAGSHHAGNPGRAGLGQQFPDAGHGIEPLLPGPDAGVLHRQMSVPIHRTAQQRLQRHHRVVMTKHRTDALHISRQKQIMAVGQIKLPPSLINGGLGVHDESVEVEDQGAHPASCPRSERNANAKSRDHTGHTGPFKVAGPGPQVLIIARRVRPRARLGRPTPRPARRGSLIMKRTLKFQEYQSAIVSEFQLLNQLADQTEYGRQGFTVVDRKKELSRKSDVNMDMMKTCKNAWASDTNLSQLFQQRSQALGEYEAYRQIYAMIKTGTK